MPRFVVAPDSLVRVDLSFHYPFCYKNGRFKKVDTANLLKLTYDAISEKIGVDDSRFKSGGFESFDSEKQWVEVTLTEVTSAKTDQ